MNTLEAIGLIGGLASIAGLLYAIYYARKNRREKLLVYDTSWSVPLATAQSPEDDYTLSVSFQRKGHEEERISSVHVQFLRFANIGKEPIRRTDIAPANPLRINVDKGRALDISLSGTSRSVTKVEVSYIELGVERSHADVTFDFLDFEDGGVIKVLTKGGKAKLTLKGDIIGMPDGIRKSDDVRSLGFINKIGCALGGMFQLSALVLAVFAYRWITGSWAHIWILILPFVALFLPAIIIAIIAATIWPGSDVSLPATLGLPRWFRRLPHYRMLRDPEAREVMFYGGSEFIEDEPDFQIENNNQQKDSADRQ
jgi:hypothetical protein